MALPDPRFIYCPPLQTYFIDKDTAEALSGGVVTFYSDVNRSVLKAIYKQVQQPDNTYEFVELANPVTLTSIGTFGDDDGNDINVYLYPFEGSPADATAGELELYYITVQSSDLVDQYTREAWPPDAEDSGANINTFVATENELTNPQFVEILFTEDPTTAAYTYSTSGTMEVDVAPGWTLVTSGTGTVTLKQVQIVDSGTTGTASNPPYALSIASTDLDSILLRQRLEASPRLLYKGFVSGYFAVRTIVAAPVSFEMLYTPSNGSAHIIVDKTTDGTSGWNAISGTVSTAGTASSDTAPDGYVDITVSWEANINIEITSLQIVGVENVNSSAEFIQQSTAQQENRLFWYYKPQLEFKPIPSYTLGWNFGMNPCQALGTTVAASGSGTANKARYIADQTIAFESVGNVLSYQLFKDAGLNPSTTGNTQFALIQYLDTYAADELIRTGRMAVQLKGTASVAINGNVSLWYTTNAAFPSVPLTSNGTTFFSTLTLGVPTTIAAGWFEIERSDLGKASFTLTPTGQYVFDFSGWELTPDPGTELYFAIVIGFETYTTANNMQINYCTLCSGDIATSPAAMNEAQTLQGLQYYYQKSFIQGTVPASSVSAGATLGVQTVGATTANNGPFMRFATPMRAIPIVTLYNPAAAGAEIRNEQRNTDYTGSTTAQISQNGFYTAGTSPGGSAVGDLIGIQWTADARLGQV